MPKKKTRPRDGEKNKRRSRGDEKEKSRKKNREESTRIIALAGSKHGKQCLAEANYLDGPRKLCCGAKNVHKPWQDARGSDSDVECGMPGSGFWVEVIILCGSHGASRREVSTCAAVQAQKEMQRLVHSALAYALMQDLCVSGLRHAPRDVRAHRVLIDNRLLYAGSTACSMHGGV